MSAPRNRAPFNKDLNKCQGLPMRSSRVTIHGVRLLAPFAVTLLAVGGLGFAFSACDTGYIVATRADAGSDGGAEAGACTCVNWEYPWAAPLWFWIGKDEGIFGSGDGVPTCPKDWGDGREAYHGHADLVAPLQCGTCMCQPPTGDCILPSTLTAHDVACQDVALPHKDIPFNAAASWDGKCDNSNPIGPGSAKSLSVDPIVIKDSCKVGAPPLADAVYPASVYWETYALGCHGRHWSTCGDVERSVCVPNDDAPSPEYKLCILRQGDIGKMSCPPDWPDKHVFYGDDVMDYRSCTDCTCGPPVGSVCKAMLSVYESSDKSCGGAIVFGQVPISSANPGPCFDQAPPVEAMGSKSATPPTYIPGKCDPMGGDIQIADGGADAGAEPTNPTTVCCKL